MSDEYAAEFIDGESTVDTRLDFALKRLRSALKDVEAVIAARAERRDAWLDMSKEAAHDGMGFGVHDRIGMARGRAEDAASSLMWLERATKPPFGGAGRE